MLLTTINLITKPLLNLLGLDFLSSYSYIIIMPILWYMVGIINKDKAEKYMFNIGFFLSQQFKKVPHWDKYVEPLLIKQLTLLFIALNALLCGMISDNDNKEQLSESLEEIKNSFKEDEDKDKKNKI